MYNLQKNLHVIICLIICPFPVILNMLKALNSLFNVLFDIVIEKSIAINKYFILHYLASQTGFFIPNSLRDAEDNTEI